MACSEVLSLHLPWQENYQGREH